MRSTVSAESGRCAAMVAGATNAASSTKHSGRRADRVDIAEPGCEVRKEAPTFNGASG